MEKILQWNIQFNSTYKVRRRLGNIYNGVRRRRDDGTDEETTVVDAVSTELYALRIWDRSQLREQDVDAVKRRISLFQELRTMDCVLPLVEFVIRDRQHTCPTIEVRFSQLARSGGAVDLLQGLLEREEQQRRAAEHDGISFTEKEAREIAVSLLQTLDVLHSRHSVVHRNIQPETIILVPGSPPGSPPKVYLADFGLACRVSTTIAVDEFGNDMEGLRTRCGIPAFCPPEMILGRPYRQPLDMWSVGCLLYVMLGGYPPFGGDDLTTMLRRIRGADFTFGEPQWKDVSTAAKKLIANLLTIKPYLRSTANQALQNSEWINNMTDASLAQHDLTRSLRCLAHCMNSRHCIRAVRWSSTDKYWDPDVEFPVHIPKDSSLPSRANAAELARPFGTNNDPLPSTSPTKDKVTFKDVYKLRREIAKGSTGSVWECQHKQSGKVFAVKISRRVPGVDEYIMYEVALMQSLAQFPKYTVKLHQFLEDGRFFYLILDFMGGGDVFDQLMERGRFDEEEARKLIWKLLKGIQCMHKAGIAHRDIKPQNLLCASKGDFSNVKLSDFGFSRREHTPKSLVGTVGTPSYVAPEVLDEDSPYDKRVDLWSVGVTAYGLLAGYPPFMESENLLYDQIRHAEYEFHPEYWTNITEEAKDFIRNLLIVDPKQRWSVEDALNSQWMQGLEEDDE